MTVTKLIASNFNTKQPHFIEDSQNKSLPVDRSGLYGVHVNGRLARIPRVLSNNNLKFIDMLHG